jgi:hypothetical protein
MKSYFDKAIDKFSERTIEVVLSSLNGHTLLIDTSLTSVNLPESVRFASEPWKFAFDGMANPQFSEDRP